MHVNPTEQIRLTLQSSKQCHVYVFDHDSTGASAMILPRSKSEPVLLSPNTPWNPPLAQLTAEIEWEELILVASTEPLPQADALVGDTTRVLTF